MSINSTKWVECHKPRPQARISLFCFPYGGAGASVFSLWPADLPGEIEVFAIQPPGRESRWREAPIRALEEFLPPLQEAMLPYLKRRFAFFGHSLGAFFAFELVRKLRIEHSLSPFHFFASGKRAPQVPNPESPIHLLPEREFVEALCERYNGIPQEVLQDADLMKMLMPPLRADLTINETYTYREDAPLDCPITAFGGLADRSTTRENLAAWRHQTTNSFKLHMFSGDHFFLKENRIKLLNQISDELKIYASEEIV